MAINYQRMQATTTRMLKQNGIAYNVTRKGKLIVIGGVEHRSEDNRTCQQAIGRQQGQLCLWGSN
ncbi:hypothetical protein NFK08_12155 [Enterobacter roggenkampii]|uniref:hypothetical protein n=1 Tax=Enterobacter roggenkampii TaxID=1812935 RepID=UPI0024301F82|nr:hypothetical protein [Enterobacter roggenkampii]WFX60790.1 hypothetical protein NFK08_12155 [Enterobacter roggenkampii]